MVEILELGKEYPDKKTLFIDFLNVYKFDSDAGKRLLDHPDQEITALQSTLRKIDLPDSDMDNLPDGVMSNAEIAIKNIPHSDKVPIHRIGHEHTDKLISIEGRITRIAPKYQKLMVGGFRCIRCGDITYTPQQDERYIEPFECQNDACGRKGAFKLIPEESEYEDQQKIGVQDLYESAKPGQPLRDIIVLLRRSDLIYNVPGMGAQCTITGIVRLQQKKESSMYHVYFEAITIEPKEAEMDMSITESEKNEFKTLAESENIIQLLIDSTASEILGYEDIKAAQLCTIVSGSSNPSSAFRENMHIMICGDPATAKTVMSKSSRALVPRAQYSAGRGSSVAGLTVAVVKDELSGSGFTAQAGAFVLADNGLMILDETDKLDEKDIQDLNTAIEEGWIDVHKGGINQKFNTRFSMIALCNPKNIRFNDDETLASQVKIPADTLSRFDMVFKVQDIPNKEMDKAIAEHRMHQLSMYENGVDEESEEKQLPLEKLSKYLQYAKTFNPKTTDEVRNAISEYYLTLRKVDGSGVLAATARQLNGLYRLTKSIAKLRLSNICSISDVNQAIKIYRASLEALRDPKTGKIDIDILAGQGKSQRDRVKKILAIIRKLSGNNGDSAHFNEIVQLASDSGITRESVEADLRHLKSMGDVIESSNGMYKSV